MQQPETTDSRELPNRPPCLNCGGPLTLTPLCPPCEGAGGWGDWLETGDDTCVTCGGTGEATREETPILRFCCSKCCTIVPPPSNIAKWHSKKSYFERLYAGELPDHVWDGEKWIIEANT